MQRSNVEPHVYGQRAHEETQVYVRMSGHTQASDSRGDTVRRITKAALGGLAGCALVLGGTQVASGAVVKSNTLPCTLLLTPPTARKIGCRAVDDTFDGAKATIAASSTLQNWLSTSSSSVRRHRPSTAGTVFGAHLHIGPLTTTTCRAALTTRQLGPDRVDPADHAEVQRRYTKSGSTSCLTTDGMAY